MQPYKIYYIGDLGARIYVCKDVIKNHDNAFKFVYRASSSKAKVFKHAPFELVVLHLVTGHDYCQELVTRKPPTKSKTLTLNKNVAKV